MFDVRPSLLALAGALVLASSALAGSAVPWDQSDRSTGGLNISQVVTATGVVLAEPARVSKITFWAGDHEPDDDGLLTSFSGTLSWAIFEDDASEPGSLVHSGAAREIAVRDTGAQTVWDADLFSVSFELDHPVSLAAGTFWVAIREGEWGSEGDDSTLWWVTTTTTVGGNARWSNIADLETWADQGSDAALVLLADRIAWDQSQLEAEPGNWWFISAHLPAIDFQLPAGGSFSSLEAWLVDDVVDDDGVLDSFSGALSWGIFANATNKPGLELDGGDAAGLVQVEAPVQAVSDNDVVRTRILLGRTVTLAAGTYWLGLHEGAWHTGGDGSIVGWHRAAAKVLNGIWTDNNPAAPGTWTGNDANDDLALVIGDSTVFASGFEAGGTCGWSTGLDNPCP